MSDSNIQRKKAAYIPAPEGGGFTPSAITKFFFPEFCAYCHLATSASKYLFCNGCQELMISSLVENDRIDSTIYGFYPTHQILFLLNKMNLGWHMNWVNILSGLLWLQLDKTIIRPNQYWLCVEETQKTNRYILDQICKRINQLKRTCFEKSRIVYRMGLVWQQQPEKVRKTPLLSLLTPSDY